MSNNNCLGNIAPNQLVLLAATIAAEISKDLTSTETNVLGNFVATVGASLMTIAAQQETIEKGK